MRKRDAFRILGLVLLCSAFLTTNALAERNPLEGIEIPSSINPVGSGARALGMGGAFIAVCDDATAASWNPGGLIQLEKPEVSAVYGFVYRDEDNDFGDHPEASGSQSVDYSNLNYLSAAIPFQAADRNMIVSLNYQHLYDFHRDWDFKYQSDASAVSDPWDFDYRQDGKLYALGLAYSAQITPTFSAGVTLNYWGDFLSDSQWKQKYDVSSVINKSGDQTTALYQVEEEFDFSGWNANLGFLWRINETWTVGGVFKTPFTADIDHTTRDTTVISSPDFAPPPVYRVDTHSEELDMPMSYGVGIACRLSDRFTVSADVHRTHWDDFEYEDYQGRKTSPISGKPSNESDIDPTTWFRLGAEYLFIGDQFVVPVRAGVFYDPAPAEGSPDDYYGFSLGSGLAYKSFIFDIAYQYRWGNDVGEDLFRAQNFSQDVDEHTVYTSLIVHF